MSGLLNMSNNIKIYPAESEVFIPQIARLFREYEQFLNVDL